MTSKTSGRPRAARPIRRGRRRRTGIAARLDRRPRIWTLAWAVLAVVAVGGLYLLYSSSTGDRGGTPAEASGYTHVAGDPGIGAAAPEFTLPASSGGQTSLADYRGRTVLLYFQEGLMCQPCWDQIRDLEQNQPALAAAGIDTVVSITTDPADLVARKMADEGLSTPVLSDPTLEVSRAYTTNQYGMMGTTRNGHTFVLVGPDGRIGWRADYGGAPDYTMFVPTQKMLADLDRERAR